MAVKLALKLQLIVLVGGLELVSSCTIAFAQSHGSSGLVGFLAFLRAA